MVKSSYNNSLVGNLDYLLDIVSVNTALSQSNDLLLILNSYLIDKDNVFCLGNDEFND